MIALYRWLVVLALGTAGTPGEPININDSDVVTQRVIIGNLAGKGVPGRKPADEYWLTEEACLFVGGRSDAEPSKLNETSTRLAGCFASDVRAYCCPSACAVKKSSHWYQANDVLRGCARGLGCKRVDSWTVGMRCNCARGK